MTGRVSSTIAALTAVAMTAAALLATGFVQRVQAAGCDLAGATPVEIDHITDDLDIVLKNERIIRLASVKALSKGDGSEAASSEFVSFVKEAVSGKAVNLRLLSPVSDRWGRVSGDVFLDGRHLQSAAA